MLKKLFLLAALVITPSVSYAADIEADVFATNGGTCIRWLDIATAETVQAAAWPGGKALVEVNGTQANADIEILFSRVPGAEIAVDSDEAPDGLRFSSAGGLGMAVADFPQGSIDIQFRSNGEAAQNLDVHICSVPDAR